MQKGKFDYQKVHYLSGLACGNPRPRACGPKVGAAGPECGVGLGRKGLGAIWKAGGLVCLPLEVGVGVGSRLETWVEGLLHRYSRKQMFPHAMMHLKAA